MSTDAIAFAVSTLVFGLLFVAFLTSALYWRETFKEVRQSRDFYKDLCKRWEVMHRETSKEADKYFWKYINSLKGLEK